MRHIVVMVLALGCLLCGCVKQEVSRSGWAGLYDVAPDAADPPTSTSQFEPEPDPLGDFWRGLTGLFESKPEVQTRRMQVERPQPQTLQQTSPNVR